MDMRLFSTDTDSGTVSVIDPSGKQLKVIARIPVGNGPRGGVMFTKSGRGFVGNSAGDTVSEIDAFSLREVAKIKVGAAPMGVGVIPGDRYALVSNSGSNYVSVIDLENRKEIHQVSVGREPRHMAITPDGTAAYVAVSGADYVAKINTAPLLSKRLAEMNEVREVKRIHVGDGALPYSVAISRSGNLALVANNQAKYVTVLDLKRDDQILANVDVGHKGGRGVGFSPDGATGFVTIEDISRLLAIDMKSRKVIREFETGPGPRGFAIDPRGKIYWVAFARLAKIGRLLTTPNTVGVIDISATKFTNIARAKPIYHDVVVGAGPCSVSIYPL